MRVVQKSLSVGVVVTAAAVATQARAQDFFDSYEPMTAWESSEMGGFTDAQPEPQSSWGVLESGGFPHWDNTAHTTDPLYEQDLGNGSTFGFDIQGGPDVPLIDSQTNPYNAPLGNVGTGGFFVTY